MDEDDIWLQYGIPKPGTNTTTPTTPAVAGVAGVRAPTVPPVQQQAAPQQESDDLWAQYGIARPSVVPETPDIPAAAPVSVMDRLAHVGQRLNEARLKLFERQVQAAQTPTDPQVIEQGAALNARTGVAPAPQMGAPAQMSRPMAADATAVAQPAARPHAELRPGLPAPLAKQATDKAAAEKPASLHEEAIKAIPSLIGAGWSAAAIASLPEAAGVTATTAAAVLPFIAADVASGTDLKQAITRNLAFVIGPEAAIGVAGRMLDLPAANPDMFKIPAQEAAPVKPAEFATHGPLADVKPKVEPKLAIGKPEPAPRTPQKTTQIPRGKVAGLDEFAQVPRFDATHRVGEATATTDVALPPHVPTVPLEEAIQPAEPGAGVSTGTARPRLSGGGKMGPEPQPQINLGRETDTGSPRIDVERPGTVGMEPAIGAAEPGSGAAGGAYRPGFGKPGRVEIPTQPELDTAGNMKPVGPTLGQTINQDLKGDLTLGSGLENPEPQGPAVPPTDVPPKRPTVPWEKASQADRDEYLNSLEGNKGTPQPATDLVSRSLPGEAPEVQPSVRRMATEVSGSLHDTAGNITGVYDADGRFHSVDDIGRNLREGFARISENIRADSKNKEAALEAERLAGSWQAKGNAAAERGNHALAEQHFAKSQKWRDRMNDLLGNGDTSPAPETPGATVESPRPESPESLLKDPRAGFFDLRGVGEGAARVTKKYVAVAGDLPKPVFDRKVVMDARISGEAVETEFAVRDFHAAMQKAYGIAGSVKPNQKELTAIDDVLRGDAHPSSLPPVLQNPVATMRAHLDRLQQRFLDEGVVEGELQAKIADSLGTYLTRAYRVHMDPDWALKVPDDVRNRFKSWIDQEYPTLTPEERDGKFNQYLFAGKDGPVAILAGNGKLGAKDLSILTRRGDIPDELRALWGEYAGDKADPLVNYTLSVAKMANLLEHHSFLRDVREQGLGKFLFEKPTVIDGESYHTPIAAKGSDTMNPLNGLHTSPEIAQAFVDALDRPPPHGKIWGAVMKINAIAKGNKTVLSPMTQVRNVIGNTFFVVANGHWRLNNVNDAIKALGAGTGLSDDAAWRALYLKLTKAGLVGQSYAEAELRTALQQSGNLGFESLTESLAKRAVRKGIDVAQTAYRAGDDVFKVYAAGNEVARYRAAYPKWTDEQLLDNAVKIVQRTYPSEAMTPRFIKAIRRTPLLGTFPSYPYQVIRSTVGVLRQAAEELANPATRAIGASRISGLTAATTFTTGMAAYSRATLGIDKNTDRDVRMFLPPWSQNSSLVYLSRQNGKLEYVDASYTDPSTYITDPIMAFMRGRDWEQKFRDSAVEIFSPFLGEGMLAEKVFDIKRNTKKTGGQVWNPEAPLEDQLVDIMEHVSGAIEPGVLSSAERIYKGVQNDQPIYGPQYDPKTEIIANATGVRRVPLDLPTAVSFRMREFRGQTMNANNILSTVAGRGGKVTDDELKSAYQESERSRRQIFDRMHEMTQAALKLGTPEPTVLNLLSAYGESKKDARNIMDGKYVPRKVTKEFLAGISDALEARSVSPADKATVRAEFKRRRTVLQGLAKESVSP